MTRGTYTRDFYLLPTILYHNGDGLYHTLELAWGKWYIGVCWKKAEGVNMNKRELEEELKKTSAGRQFLEEAEPCEDAISREDVIKAIDRHTFETDDGLCLDEDITIVLEDLPPVKPVRKKGKWIKSNIGGAKVCSICQAHMGLSNFKYCPNCGAEMESEE